MNMFFKLLDNWRERVVPVLWALFWAGVLLGGAQRIDSYLGSSYSGLSVVASSGIRQGVVDHLPGRLGFFDSWVTGEVRSSDSSDLASGRAVVRYFNYDGGARLVLGAKEASGLVVWSSQITSRFLLWPGMVLSFLIMSMSFYMILFRGGRKWRAIGYFSSRVLVLCAYGVVAMAIAGAFGHLWLVGSAASRLTDLPVTVPLWASVLSAGPLVKASAWLVVVFCLSSGLEALFPDP
nr:hypothetical protein [uncultured Dethiosulfovibrio sp.]